MRARMIAGGGVLMLASVLYAIFGTTSTKHENITVDQAFGLIQSDSSVIVLDVRTPEEYESQTGHLAHALLIPVQQLEERMSELNGYKAQTIIAYCRTGNRSGRAATLLNKHGFTVLNMDGGITAWNKDRLPVVLEDKK